MGTHMDGNPSMKIFGIILLVLGLLLTLTIVFFWIGIPLMMVGAVLVVAGGKAATITNIVQVSAHPGSSNSVSSGQQGQQHPSFADEPTRQAIDVTPRRDV